MAQVSAAGRPVRVQDQVASPLQPEPERLRDCLFEAVPALTAGLVRSERWTLKLGPVALLRFGEPAFEAGGWRWPILGGALARGPGGELGLGWRDGRVYSLVDGYRPWLPPRLYALTQLPFHHLVTRLVLLRARGRTPPPGLPAAVSSRLAAGTCDLALCLAAGLAIGRGARRGLPLAGLLAAGVHVAGWRLLGGTPAALLFGLRVVSVDGSAPDLFQAFLRLLALPAAAVRLAAAHDDLAATEVVRRRAG
jgi:hypothetical protein